MTDETMGTTKILESMKLRGIFEMAMQDNKSSLQYKQLIQSFFVDNDVRANYLRMVIEAEEQNKDLNLDRDFRREFEIEARNQFDKKFTSMDNLSLLGSLNFTKADDRFLSWRLLNKRIFLKIASGTNGTFTTLTGLPGSGKTDFALRLAQVARAAGKQVITNIMVDDGSGEIHHVNTVSGFLVKVIELSRAGVDVVFIIDEAGITWDRKDAMTKRNRNWEKLARLIRKFHTNLVYIVQEIYNIPPQVQNFRSVIIHKYSKKKCRFEYKNGAGSFQVYINEVPRTKTKFDTDDISFFSFDLDLDRLFNYITGTKTAEGQRDRILKFIERSQKKDDEPKRGSKLKGQIVRMKEANPSMSNSRIAKVLACSKTHVTETLIEARSVGSLIIK